MSDYSIEIFSTCPQSADVDREKYIDCVKKVARWSEDCGFKGTLVYADNRLVDPWIISQVIIENTGNLSPLVAIQPIYMHPYTVAKKVSSFGFMHNRKIYLNMVAGGFKNDLIALNDTTPHDDRYKRLTEYTTIIKKLLEGDKPLTFAGKYYKTENLSLKPSIDKEIFPEIFVSGSSAAGMNAAQQLNATAIQYPNPPDEYEEQLTGDSIKYGIRIGIIARDEEDAAWEVAYNRFPASRSGQIAHKFAMKTSDSVWHKKLSNLSNQLNGHRSSYWLHPFKNYKTFCPYLVGSYKKVAKELSRYIGIGYRTFILDIPPSREELIHINRSFEMAKDQISV